MNQSNIQDNPAIVRLPVVGLLLAAACCAVGCRNGVYNSRTLPSELSAPAVANVEVLNLSSLSGSSIRNDVIYPGDLLEVKLHSGYHDDQPDISEVRVSEDGGIALPLVGTVQVGDREIMHAQQIIREASIQRRVFLRPLVTVAIKQRRFNRVTVSGAVNSPGEIELPVGKSHLMAALISAGGLSGDADRLVDIRKPTVNSAVQPAGYPAANSPQAGATTVDLVAATSGGRGEIYLSDGDVVNVQKQPRRFVQVIGLIAANQQIELPPNRDVRLLDVIAQAGGLKYSYWVSDRVSVIRRMPNSDKSVRIKLSLRRAKRNQRENIRLAAGDVINVEENVVTFTLSTVQGLVGVGTTAAQGATVFP